MSQLGNIELSYFRCTSYLYATSTMLYHGCYAQPKSALPLSEILLFKVLVIPGDHQLVLMWASQSRRSIKCLQCTLQNVLEMLLCWVTRVYLLRTNMFTLGNSKGLQGYGPRVRVRIDFSRPLQGLKDLINVCIWTLYTPVSQTVWSSNHRKCWIIVSMWV